MVKKIRQPTEMNDLQEEIEDEDEDKKTTKLPDWDKVIYDIVQTNGHKFSVKYSQISDIIGEEEWVDGEMNTLSNIGSHQIVNLSFGAKKKEKKNNTQILLEDLSTHNKKAKKKRIEYSESNKSKDLLIIGDCVIVMNHAMKWINYAKVIGINVNENWAIVKWESTSKIDRVKLCDCKKYEENHVGHRKQKQTEFYMNEPINRHMKTEQSELEVQMENRFYSEDNLSKLCAEGAVRNLMNMLHCLRDELDTFWEMATMIVQETQFDLKYLLKKKKGAKWCDKRKLEVDSIEISLWILQKKFNFATTSKLKLSCFQCVKQSLKALLEIKFHVINSVQAQRATYIHVAVIWKKMVIDYESKDIYPLTEDSLRQVCGFTTTFQKITCGYGIFPLKYICQSPENVHIKDWSTSEYYEPGGSIRKYFK
jgi:hypothetical protein